MSVGKIYITDMIVIVIGVVAAYSLNGQLLPAVNLIMTDRLRSTNEY